MSNLSVWEIIKYAFKALLYKIEQYRLNTGVTFTIETSNGPIRGVKRLSVWNGCYYSFEGIPYAKPPLDDLRFRAPEPAEPWTEVLNCAGPSEIPMQGNIIFRKYKGSEDCLYLNIFTNEINPNILRPVMVWLYGGGFQMGEATRDLYSPDYFMSKNIVLVTVAYRLGPFGFLSFDDPSVNISGNAGIKDQILALKWIQQNIGVFGGDAGNVTLFGESAGGASTHLCMLSKHTEGLVHKAIIMSGCILCPWALSPAKNLAYRLAQAMHYGGENDSKEIYKFLKAMPASDIQKAVPLVLKKEEKHNRIMFAFGPVVEPYESADSVLTVHPSTMLKETASNNIPLLIGGNSFEGLLFYPEIMKRKATLEEVGDCENLLPADITHEFKSKEMALKLKSAYFGSEECNLKNIMQFLELESYREFWHPIYRTALMRSRFAKAPTYLYRFDYDSPVANSIRNLLCGSGMRGACHGDDLCYLFRFIFSHKLTPDSEEHRITTAMIDIWTSFAANGDPNCESLGEVNFLPLAKDEPMKCLNISKRIDFIDLPELAKIPLWESFYEMKAAL